MILQHLMYSNKLSELYLIIIVRIMYSFQMGSAQFFHQNSIIFSEVFLSFGATEIYHMYIGNPPPPSTKMCGKVLFSGFL